MYKYRFDITDKLEAPSGKLISIADAEIRNAKYDGTEKKPEVIYDGKILTEGTDYFLYNASASDSFVEAGSYQIIVYGKGSYGGSIETLYEVIDNTDFASREEFGNMCKADYESKNDTEVTPEAIRNPDGTVTVYLLDSVGSLADTYTLNAKTGIGADENGTEVNLPQTGMSGAHKAVTGLAALMLLSGAILVKKSRKED